MLQISTVIVDQNDPYGSCIYKYDGQVVSGTINVKPGEKITLEYSITDSGYSIEGATGILRTPIGKGRNEKNATESLTIDDRYDGLTLSRQSFGIYVRREA